MGIIRIRDLRCHAFHGCLPEEAIVGGAYSLDADIETDFTGAAVHDDLHQTVDYCDVRRIVEREMAIRSRLIEHVAQRIGDALLAELPRIDRLTLTVTKWAPPMGGQVEAVSVVSEFRR